MLMLTQPAKRFLTPFLLLALSASRVLAADKLDPQAAVEIATAAYIYGYPLLTTEVTRIQMTNTIVPMGFRAPLGQFIVAKRFPPIDYHGIPAPNADTVYAAAWIDVGENPVQLSYSDMGKRYFMLPLYSQWQEIIATPGVRTTGSKANTFLITGPTWQGEVPPKLKQIKSPTRYVLVIARAYADGSEEDVVRVNGAQRGFRVATLKADGKSGSFKPPPVDLDPPFSMTDETRRVIEQMDIGTYFQQLATILGSSAPPAPQDAPLLAKLAKLGIIPGQPFDLAKLDKDVQIALQTVPAAAMKIMTERKNSRGTLVNGWSIPAALCEAQPDFYQREMLSSQGWPKTLPEDLVEASAQVDSAGKKLHGQHRYTVTFPKGQTPPVDGLWSLMLYVEDEGWWSHPNKANRWTLNNLRDKLHYNEDGSLTLLIQPLPPDGPQHVNWLPTPAGDFVLMLRLYQPSESGLSILPLGKGTWQPPPVVKVE